MDSKVVFSISTDLEFRGRQLKALKPDKDGVYKGIPLTVIGLNSRNGINYDRDSVISCLTDPKSRFVMNLKSGDLEGEWGHPFLGVEPKAAVARLLHLDRKNVSHYFTRIYTSQLDGSEEAIIVYGDVVPNGPMGKYLKENFEDPKRNVSFSLRAATQVIRKSNGVTYKQMLAMFTFDAVDGPGYVECSKRFRDPAFESLGIAVESNGNIDISVDREAFLNATKSFEISGMESKIIDQRVLDAFGCDEVVVKDKVLRKLRNGFADAEGRRVSLFDQAFGL